MPTMVSSAASPRAMQRAKRRRRPAGTAAPVQPPAAPPVPKPASAAAAAAATLSPAQSTVPATLPAAAAAEKSPEYDPMDVAGVIGDISGGLYGGVANDMIGPHIKAAINQVLSPERFPILGSTYGKVIPGRVAGIAIAEAGNLIGNVAADALRGALHGKLPGVEAGKPGIGWTPTPANKLIAKLVKGVTTSWADIAIRDFLKPPPSPPAPVYPPDVKPLPPTPVPAPPPPKTLMGQPIGAVIQGAVTDAVYKTVIGAAYDQIVGPLVQRAANFVTGRSSEEIKAPKPLTPGRVVNGFVDSVLGSLLVRSVKYPAGAPGTITPFAATLGTSIINNVIGAAWGTVYGRGLGTSIENGVNQLAGIRTKEEVEKAKLPALEHFTRAATRGVAVGATTYVLGNALNATMVQLGGSIGGVGGALVAMAGAALIGSIGGSVVDATIGPMLGKLGGQVYSWISGKPTYEQRMEEAAKQPSPGPTPGDPVKAPNGNPGTVPAPAPAPAPAAPKAPAAPAQAAPAAGAPKKRRRSGNAAIDRTAPAFNVPTAKLAAIAAKG